MAKRTILRTVLNPVSFSEFTKCITWSQLLRSSSEYIKNLIEVLWYVGEGFEPGEFSKVFFKKG